MNKVERTRLRHRIRAAWRALRGKPSQHLNIGLGVELKRCSDCLREAVTIDLPQIIDDAIQKKDRYVTIFSSDCGVSVSVYPLTDEEE